MKILIIDDDASVRQTIATVMEAEGHKAESTDNATDGLSALLKFAPDLVLVDIAMPIIDGKRVIEWIRTTNPNVPIVAISGDPKQHQEALKRGATAFLTKPLPKNFPEILSQFATR